MSELTNGMVRMLTELKQKAEKEEKEMHMVEGEIKHLLQTLSEDYNCSNIKEAEKALIKVEKKCYELRNSMNDKIDRINENYEF